MKQRITIFVAMILAINCVQAQKSINGSLRNSTDMSAIPYANIALLRQADSSFVRGTTSDDNGNFSLAGDTVATILRVSAIGFEPLFVPINDSTAGATVNVGFLSLKEGSMLNEVSITDKKPMYAVDGEKSIYNVREDPTIQSGTAQDALQNAPGIRVDGDGNITLNGNAVTVYINDRESHYTGEMLKQYIKTLTADQISSIEVMEYPSAKYGGRGPVVNIRTEQNMLRNSYLSFGASGSSRPDVSPFISYAYANKKLRFDTYVRYSWDTWKSQSEGDGEMFSEDSTRVRQYHYSSQSSSKDHDFNISFSLGYDFDSMNTLSAYVDLSPSWYKSVSDGNHVQTDLVGTIEEDFSHTTHGDSRNGYMWGYGNISFEHKFNNEGHMLSVSAGGYASGSLGRNTSNSWEHYVAQTQLNYDQQSVNSYSYRNIDVDVDYSYPYSENGEFSAGLGFGYGGNNSYYLRDTLAADGLYHCDALRSDSTESPDYSTTIYLSWRRKFGNFTIRIGGNMKYLNDNNRHLHSPEFDTSIYNLIFGPNITLMYRTKSMHSFSLNYSTYTSTPAASQLDRYVSYGTDSYSTGNPNLENTYSHTLGLSYSKYFENGHNLGINARGTMKINGIDEITLPEYSPFFGRYVSFTMPYNTGDSRSATLYAHGTWRFSALLSASLNFGLEDDWYRVQIRPGEWFEDEMASWNTRLSVRAKVFNLVWVSVSGDYNSRSHGWSTMEINEPRWGVNASASADLFDRKLSFYLNVNDIFNTANWNSTSINPYTPSTDNYTYNSQYITFGVTLRFGKMELGNDSKEGIQESSSGKGGK